MSYNKHQIAATVNWVSSQIFSGHSRIVSEQKWFDEQFTQLLNKLTQKNSLSQEIILSKGTKDLAPFIKLMKAKNISFPDVHIKLKRDGSSVDCTFEPNVMIHLAQSSPSRQARKNSALSDSLDDMSERLASFELDPQSDDEEAQEDVVRPQQPLLVAFIVQAFEKQKQLKAGQNVSQGDQDRNLPRKKR